MNDRQNYALTRDPAGTVWTNLVLAIWVIISPFVLAFPSSRAIWNNVATGVVVGILAIIRLSVRQQRGWSWINVLLGIWLIISPFVLGFVAGAALWNDVVLGIIIAAMALNNATSPLTVRA
jgi:SPW repeat